MGPRRAESGNDGLSDRRYLLTVVMHDQSHSIADSIGPYEGALRAKGLPASMRSMSSEKRSMSPKAFDRLVPPLNTMDSAKPLLWKRWSKV